MAEATDWRTAYRCPVDQAGSVKAQTNRSGTCFHVERVQRNGQKGFITTLHNRATARRAGYSAPLPEGRACLLTQDPFRAEVRSERDAVDAGAACARKLSVPKKFVRPKKKKKAKKKRARKRVVTRRG